VQLLSSAGSTDKRWGSWKKWRRPLLILSPDNTVPVATAKTEDVKNVRNKDTLEINDVKYEVKRIRPDGTGLTELIMSKV